MPAHIAYLRACGQEQPAGHVQEHERRGAGVQHPGIGLYQGKARIEQQNHATRHTPPEGRPGVPHLVECPPVQHLHCCAEDRSEKEAQRHGRKRAPQKGEGTGGLLPGLFNLQGGHL